MQSSDLATKLGFNDSPSFLRAGRRAFEEAPGYGHIFRRAAKKSRGGTPGPGVVGVYVLRSNEATENTPAIPTLYVCRADSDSAADRAHQLIWNQDVVPFVIIETSTGYRLYSGFEYERRPDRTSRNLLQTFNDATELADAGFHADAIDDGTLWRKWGKAVRPEARVDWTLLGNLRTLDEWLQQNGLSADTSHSLIGKYVYLHYLRDRDILSDRKLDGWRIPSGSVFGRNATVDGLKSVVARLDEWLNGGVFPLKFGGKDAPKDAHVRWVAATFAGDSPSPSGDWQLHLDFKAYDFSYIPIETLSVVYEQFLHSPAPGGRSRGKDAGAYYTPVPVVNFMLAEMEDHRPLEEGTRVLDPSCGSGAFLVQCYRRLIEKSFSPRSDAPRPVQLRELMQRSIFGVDRDGDACSVAELSLILTLLDYCNPPDLEDGTRFKLPSLRGTNIFSENFFRSDPDCFALLGRRKFDWVVGNPPWKGLNSRNISNDDLPTWEWMQEQDDRGTPVGDYEVAQAFAWEVGKYVAPRGIVGLLMPAMGLFEDPSQRFRQSFFRKFRVHSVANFSNLTESLFAGRSRDPAAAFFYSPRPSDGQSTGDSEYISFYSPFVANQEATRPVVENKRNETWSLVVNESEVRRVALEDAVGGSSLPWKVATWGSHLDMRLLERLAARHKSLGQLEDDHVLVLSRGPELFTADPGASSYDVEKCEEVVGKNALDVNPLKRLRRIFRFPSQAIVKNEKHFLRGRGGKRGLIVCRPPHIIVSEARNFAVFANEYLVVPSGQIGITSVTGDERFLKALAVYLNSDFAYYHQFLTSSRLGVKRPVATLSALRELPVPLPGLSAAEVDRWVKLHDQLEAASTVHPDGDPGSSLFSKQMPHDAARQASDTEQLFEQLNTLVYSALGIRPRERALVEDLVHVRLELDDGRTGVPAVEPPTTTHLKRYARRLKSELDAFVGDELRKRHDVDVVHDQFTGMVQVTLVKSDEPNEVEVYSADDGTAAELERTRRRLRREHAQWVYFDRNLQLFEGRRSFVFKPMQRFHWTESQAMSDAAEIISQTLGSAGDSVD